MDNPTTLVLGIGNTLLTDEGIGIHVIHHLEAVHPDRPDVTLIDGGTLSFTLAEVVATHPRLIVVDAAYTGSDPGTVSCFEGAAMDRYLKGNRKSVHEVGLTDLLDIARLSDCYPKSRALVGIEPHSLDWGEQPTPPVAAAIPRAAAEVWRLIGQWSDRTDDPG
jgi:hydrogenase maturation protease